MNSIPAATPVEPAGRATIGLWAAVLRLIVLRLRISYNEFRRARLLRKIAIICIYLLMLVFVGIVFWGSWALLKLLRDPDLARYIPDMAGFVEQLPVAIFAAAFLGILITSFGVLLQALYLAGDMDFLLSRPLPMRAVFLTKMLQAILPNLALIGLFALPVTYGLGISSGYNLLFYPFVLIVLVALALAAAGTSSLLVMGVVRIVPARRAAEVLGFLGATISFLCSQSGQLAQWSDVSESQAMQAFNSLQRFNSPWLPLTWAGRGLVALGKSQWLEGILFLGLTLGVAAGIFWIALVSAERLYYTGWASMQVVGQKKKRPSRAARTPDRRLSGLGSLLARLEGWSPPALRAILVKDWLVLRRDLRNMSQLVTPLIIGIIYAFMLLRGGNEPFEGRGEAPQRFVEIMKGLMVYMNIFLALFVGWMLMGRLAGMGFSQEGKNYWLLKTSPVSAGRLIMAKFLVAYLPVMALSWLFLFVIWLVRSSGLLSLLFALLVVAFYNAGNAGLNLAFGILGANMAWEDPRQMQRGWSSCLGALVTMLYLPFGILFFFAPPIASSLLHLPEYIGQLAGLALGGVFCLVVAAGPLWLVRQRVERLGEG